MNPPLQKKAQTRLDPYIRVDETEDPSYWAEILERRWRDRQFQLLLRQAFQGLGLKGPGTTLDLGCGTGVSSRALARLGGPRRRILGVDVSQRLIEEAKRQRGRGVSFVIAQGERLPLPDESVDGTVMVTLLPHALRPGQILQEVFRVTKPRGYLLSIDQDHETLTVFPGERVLTRKILNAYCDARVDGWVGRKQMTLLRRHGFIDVKVTPFVALYTDYRQHPWPHLATRMVKTAEERGAVTAEEGRRWLKAIGRGARSGFFFSSLNYYFAFGRRP